MTPNHSAGEVARRWAARVELWRQAFAGIALADREVLDAGTGAGWFTRFLAEQRPARVVSITCQPGEIEPARRRLGPLADRVEFFLADLASLTSIPDGRFDAVGADFLIAAVSAYRPFREIDTLGELVRVLRPRGTLVVTGWEPTAQQRSPAAAALRRLLALREAIHHLAGTPPFREHPSWWVADRLHAIGVAIERICTVPDVHRDLSWLVANVRQLLEGLEDRDLAGALSRQLDTIAANLAYDRAFEAGLVFGQLYAVVARKPARLLDPLVPPGT